MKFLLPLSLIFLCVVSANAEIVKPALCIDRESNADPQMGANSAADGDSKTDKDSATDDKANHDAETGDDSKIDFNPKAGANPASDADAHIQPAQALGHSINAFIIFNPVKKCQRRVNSQCTPIASCGRIIGTNNCQYFPNDCTRQLLNCERVGYGQPEYERVGNLQCLGIAEGVIAPCESGRGGIIN